MPARAGKLLLKPWARHVREEDLGPRSLLEEARGEVGRAETQLVAQEKQQCSGIEAEPLVQGLCTRLETPCLQHSMSHPVGLGPPEAVDVVAATKVLVPEEKAGPADSLFENEAAVRELPQVDLPTRVGGQMPEVRPQGSVLPLRFRRDLQRHRVLPEGHYPIQLHQDLKAAVGPCRGR